MGRTRGISSHLISQRHMTEHGQDTRYFEGVCLSCRKIWLLYFFSLGAIFTFHRGGVENPFFTNAHSLCTRFFWRNGLKVGRINPLQAEPSNIHTLINPPHHINLETPLPKPNRRSNIPIFASPKRRSTPKPTYPPTPPTPLACAFTQNPALGLMIFSCVSDGYVMELGHEVGPLGWE